MSTWSTEGDLGYHLKGAVNVPLGDRPRRFASSAMAHTIAGFIDAVGPAGGKNVNDGHRIGGRAVLLFAAGRAAEDHPADRLPGGRRRTASIAKTSTTSLATNLPTRSTILGQRQQYLRLREKFRDKTDDRRPYRVVRLRAVELTSVTSHTIATSYVSRDATRADRI